MCDHEAYAELGERIEPLADADATEASGGGGVK